MKKILLILCIFLCINVKASITVMDADSGRVLYSKNQNDRKLIASTTKIMTSLIALEYGQLNDMYTVSDEIDEVNGSMLYLKKNEKISLNDLLYGLNLRSGNDAAMVISNNVMKYDEFINMMNIKASELNMYNTTFENPHGLNDKTKNYSTSYDLCLLMKYAIKNKEFLKISSTKKYKTNTNLNEYIWYNKNELLNDYKYTIAGKIGYTKSSGQVLVSSARKNGKTLLIASIDESDKFNLHKKLYEEYFEKYSLYKILDKYNFSINDKKYDNYYFYINNDVKIMLTNDEYNNLKIKARLYEDIVNNVAGYLDFIIDEKTIYSEKLYALEYNNRKKYIKSNIKLFFNKMFK